MFIFTILSAASNLCKWMIFGTIDLQAAASNNPDDDTLKKNEEYFANLEKQYEVARATTHTQRGLGLGFTSRGAFPVHPK